MGTLGQRAVDIAEGQLGVHESPWGSNCGGCEKYQAMYPYLGKCGWPWCGAFVGWVWEQVRAGSKQYSDPSTATMCSAKPNVKAQPGAAFVICGTHTGLLRYQVSGSVWATVEGNHSDQVGYDQRDISGMEIVGPPWLGDTDGGATPAPPPEAKATWYFLQDVGAPRKEGGQRMYYGGWSTAAARDQQYANLKKHFGHEFRKFKDGDFTSEYFVDNSAFVTEIYGGWESAASRDSARKTLEDRLKRTLRPFSESRSKAQGGVPWGCQNLEDP